MNFVSESCFQYEEIFKIGVVTSTYVRLVYLSFPLGCIVVDTRGVKLSEICGRVYDDSHVFTTFWSLLGSTLLSLLLKF